MNRKIYIIKPGNKQGNCYFIKTCSNNILIITGSNISTKNIEYKLSDLNFNNKIDLIILTQFCKYQHTNINYFKNKYNSQIAMHVIDYMMPDTRLPFILNIKQFILKLIYTILNFQPLIPDLIIDEGYNLSEYGLNARVINLSSFVKGTIGILTDEGELFCDDVFIAASSSSKIIIEKFKKLLVDIIYSGKGSPVAIQS